MFGVGDERNAVCECDVCDDHRQAVLALQPSPGSGGRDDELEDHQPGGLVREGTLGSNARGIQKDASAVLGATTEPWSNGQTEGQVNKLKLVKRQMYGRAKVDLLDARLLAAA